MFLQKCFMIAMSLSLPVTEQQDHKDRLNYICRLYTLNLQTEVERSLCFNVIRDLCSIMFQPNISLTALSSLARSCLTVTTAEQTKSHVDSDSFIFFAKAPACPFPTCLMLRHDQRFL